MSEKHDGEIESFAALHEKSKNEGRENVSTTVFMCKTDWDYEIGNGTVEVYDTIEQLKKERTCVAECGIVEVEVTLKRVVAQRSDGF